MNVTLRPLGDARFEVRRGPTAEALLWGCRTATPDAERYRAVRDLDVKGDRL